MNPRYYILALILTLLFACTAGKQPLTHPQSDKLITGQIDKAPVYNEPTPESFLQIKFPTSAIMLNSVVSYIKTFVSTHMASDIKAVAHTDNNTLYLTDSSINIGLNNCDSLLTESEFTDIQAQGRYILAYNDEKMELYDTDLCGGILSGRMKLKNIRLIPPYLVFYEDKAFSISQIGMRDEYLSGTMQNSIMDINGTDQFLSIINNVGQLVTLDIMAKEFIYSEDISVNFTDWRLSKYTLFGITDDQFFTSFETIWDGNKFLLKKRSVKDLAQFDQCILADKGVAMTCDTTFITPQRTFLLDKAYQRFMITDTAYYGIYNNELYQLLTDKKRYIKKVDIQGYKVHACLQDNILLLHDIDKKMKGIDLKSDNMTFIDTIDNCTTALELVEGNLTTPDNMSIYPFAEKVKSDNQTSLFKRTIEDNIYYYFLQN